MSQNDFIIANQTAPSFRSDLNNALQAAVSNSSGTSAPSTTYANMLWYDTVNNILKMRSEADDAWISIGKLNQSTNQFFPYVGSTQITAFLDQDTMSSNSATAVASQQSIKAYSDGNDIGVGQTWQDLTGSRSANTSYQNTTGKPIMVAIVARNTTVARSIEVSATGAFAGEEVVIGEVTDAAAEDGNQFIVPNNHYYRINGSVSSITSWSELR